MKFVGKLISILLVLGLLFIVSNQAVADQRACNPVDVKPEALGSMVIVPDIVAVGGNVVARMPTDGGAGQISISAPKEYFEVVDYSPKTITGGTAKAGEWAAESGKNLPAGNYDLTLKAKHYTSGKWVDVSATAAVWGGTHYAHQAFFIYYDTMPLIISLSERNEAPQVTMDVVRKITVEAVPDVAIDVSTDHGSLGKTIASSSGPSLQVKANKEGQAELYLFAQEKQKVKLSASSPDSCQDSNVNQTFTVKRSDVGRNVSENYDWIWWLGGITLLTLLVIVAFLLWRKKKHQQQSIQQTDTNTNANQKYQPQSPQESETVQNQPPSSNQNEASKNTDHQQGVDKNF